MLVVAIARLDVGEDVAERLLKTEPNLHTVKGAGNTVGIDVGIGGRGIGQRGSRDLDACTPADAEFAEVRAIVIEQTEIVSGYAKHRAAEIEIIAGIDAIAGIGG